MCLRLGSSKSDRDFIALYSVLLGECYKRAMGTPNTFGPIHCLRCILVCSFKLSVNNEGHTITKYKKKLIGSKVVIYFFLASNGTATGGKFPYRASLTAVAFLKYICTP